MIISFEGKVALVTGAASGLWFATAKAFAESGASVALADVNEKQVQVAAKELSDERFKALAIRCDVSNDDEVEAMVKHTVATFGRLDMAFNNSGIQNVLAETADSPRDDYDRVMAGQSEGSLEFHEVRTAGHARTRKRSHRQLLLSRRPHRRQSAWNVSRSEAWRDRFDEECGSRICNSRHSCECCMPWSYPYSDGRQDGGCRARRGLKNDARNVGSDAARRPTRRDCEHSSVPVQ